MRCLESSLSRFRLYEVDHRRIRDTASAATILIPAMLRSRGTDRSAALRVLSRPHRRLQRAYSTRGAGVTPASETSSRDNHTPTSENPPTVETHAAGPSSGQTQAQTSLNSSPPIDAEALWTRLRDWGVLTSSLLGRRADQFSNKATTTFSNLGQHLNRVTGYEEIEALKRQVVAQGIVLSTLDCF